MESIGLVQNSVPIIVKFPEVSSSRTGTDTLFFFKWQIWNDINSNIVQALGWSSDTSSLQPNFNTDFLKKYKFALFLVVYGRERGVQIIYTYNDLTCC